MSKQSMLRLTPELSLLVEMYQQANRLDTTTAALYELIARGYANWQMEADQDGVQPPWCADQVDEDRLFDEFDQQQEEKWFALWFARKFAPKHGGKRAGSGRKATAS